RLLVGPASSGSGGRLSHSYRQGVRGAPAMLDDYANVIAAALALHEVTGERAYRDDAERAAAAVETYFADPAGGYFFTAHDAAEAPAPELVLQILGSGDSLPAGHPAQGKRMVDGKATAYVCRGPVCSLPVTAPDALAEALVAG